MPPVSTLNIPVVVGRSPASPNGSIPGTPGTTTTLHADLAAEYVAGSAYGMYAQYLKALPWAIDQISQDFGDDIFERMQLDGQVAADLTVLKSSILEDGLNLSSAVSDRTDPDYDLASQISDTITKNLENLSTPIDDVLWNLLDALALGNRVAEQKYHFDTINGKRGLWLEALKVKPRHATAFLVDAYNNVLGLLAQMPTGFSPVQIGSVLTDISQQPNLIAREKFAIYTFRPVNNDPRGTSILQAAYRPWWFKQQVIGEYLRYLTQFASPSVLGFTDPNAQTELVRDSLGNPILDTNGNPVAISPEQTMFDNLQKWRNGGLGVFHGGGARVDLVQSSGEGQAFTAALDSCNRDITKAILVQTLATDEAKHMARSASSVHKDVLDTLVRQAKRGLVRMIVRDMFRPLVRNNWGEGALHLVPTTTLGVTEQAEFATEGDTVAKLYTSGFIGDSQKAGLDERLGLPERDADADAAALEAAKPPPPVVMQSAPPAEGQPPTQPDKPGVTPKPAAVPPTQKPAEAKAA